MARDCKKCKYFQWMHPNGNGELRFSVERTTCHANISYELCNEDKPVPMTYLVRKWDDTEWHKPTREYLGLEDK